MRPLLLLLLVGCEGKAPSEPTTTTDAPPIVEPYTQTLPSGPCSVGPVTGTVPGVTLTIRSESCVFSRGQAATFTYDVTVDATVPAITVPQGNTCECGETTPDPMDWIAWRIGGTSAGGARQQYCLCDTGCCPPLPERTIQLTPTTASDTIEWTGQTWDGPSDTGNPKGDAFLPGRYTVTVALTAYDQGSVSAELPIEVVYP